MYQEWIKKFEEIIKTNNEINKIKRKSKALDEIMKITKKYNLELTRGQNGELIIKGIL